MMGNQEQIKTVSANALHGDSNVFVVDVRTPVEFNEKHIPGADLHPLHQLEAAKVREQAGGRTVCLICRTGNRARQAAAKLAEAGCGDVTVLEGGVEAWESSGLPLNRGVKGMSLERQVRIGAGSLVLIGVIGALAIHPGFLALSGFVGAGLIFAGVTDWCGMGLLLARMPWNQKTGASCCSTKS